MEWLLKILLISNKLFWHHFHHRTYPDHVNIIVIHFVLWDKILLLLSLPTESVCVYCTNTRAWCLNQLCYIPTEPYSSDTHTIFLWFYLGQFSPWMILILSFFLHFIYPSWTFWGAFGGNVHLHEENSKGTAPAHYFQLLLDLLMCTVRRCMQTQLCTQNNSITRKSSRSIQQDFIAKCWIKLRMEWV